MIRTLRYLSLGVVVALAACDSGLDLDGVLDDAEAAALGEAIFSETYANTSTSAPNQPGTVAGGPAMVMIDYDASADGTVQCQLGGSVDIDGTVSVNIDTETQVTSLSYSMTRVHRDCDVAGGGDTPVTFTLNGSPSLVTELMITTNAEGGFEIDGSMAGGVQWETDGRAGVCTIAVEFSGGGNQTQGTGEFQMNGTICGVNVQQQVAVS